MSNCYTIITASDYLVCSRKKSERLDALLHADKDACHGFKLEYDGDEGWASLYAEESGNESELPEEFLQELGRLIASMDMQFLEFGAAQYNDKPKLGSTGGYQFRIMTDGQIVYPTVK